MMREIEIYTSEELRRCPKCGKLPQVRIKFMVCGLGAVAEVRCQNAPAPAHKRVRATGSTMARALAKACKAWNDD